jgi:predicted dehydrogenase/nucleoside-diphosphate-sugar epimerase
MFPKDPAISDNTDMKNPLNILLLGAGAVTENLHLPALERLGWLGGCEVVDPDSMALARLRSQWPQVRFSATGFAEQIERTRSFDTVVVALPNKLHFDACKLFLDAGVPVLCEKPLALTAAECLVLDRIATRSNVALGVAMARRHTVAFRALVASLRQGIVGEIHSIEVSHGGLYEWPSVTGEPFRAENGGVLADMGVHFLDLCARVAGPLELVSYDDDCFGGVEAECTMQLRAGSGVPVKLMLSRRRPLENVFRVVCSKGELTMRADDFAHCKFVAAASGIAGDLQLIGSRGADFVDAFVEQYQQWMHQIKDATAVMSSATDHAAIIQLIERAYQRRSVSRVAVLPRESADRYLVTGATGFIGTRLVERLGETSDVRVRCLLRSYRRAAGIARFPVELIRQELSDVDAITQSMRDVRYVVHLAYGNDGPDEARGKTTIAGTRNVVEAAIAEGVEAVVILSTLWVFGLSESLKEIDETAPYRPYGGTYANDKAEMEKWCLQRAKTSGKTRIIVLNPGNVYGPHGYAYTELPLSLASKSAFAWVDGGVGQCHYNHVDNLVDAILLACKTEAAHAQRFIIFDDRLSWRQFLTPLLGSMADTVPSMTQREIETRSATNVSLLQLAHVIVGNPEIRSVARNIPIVKWLYDKGRNRVAVASVKTSTARFATNEPPPETVPTWLAELYPPSTTRFSAKKARDILGWAPRISVEEGTRLTREWWLARLASSSSSRV